MSGTGPGRRILVVLQGGIGNQLFQWCAGETLRKRTGHPVFYDCELGFRNDSFGRRFELPELVGPAQRATPAGGSGVWRSPLQERVAVTVERRLMFRRGICSLPLGGALAMARWWPATEVVCRSCFQSLAYVDGEIADRIRRGMGLQREDTVPEVAVHFRLARDLQQDGAPAAEFQGTVLGLPYYREALRAVRAAHGEARFRVFSDTGTIPEGVFAPGDQVVLDVPLQDEAPSRTLSRMARCSHFVIANSTFSWWAAYLGLAEGKHVYAPREWRFSHQTPSQRGIFPKEWRRIEAAGFGNHSGI